nr:MAG TPA: hypothetical protein [Caudoviricetes sp.]
MPNAAPEALPPLTAFFSKVMLYFAILNKFSTLVIYKYTQL